MYHQAQAAHPVLIHIVAWLAAPFLGWVTMLKVIRFALRRKNFWLETFFELAFSKITNIRTKVLAGVTFSVLFGIALAYFVIPLIIRAGHAYYHLLKGSSEWWLSEAAPMWAFWMAILTLVLGWFLLTFLLNVTMEKLFGPLAYEPVTEAHNGEPKDYDGWQPPKAPCSGE